MKAFYLTPLLLVGCATIEKPPCADIPVFDKPQIIMPTRPVLRDPAGKSDGQIVRELQMNVNDLKTYATQLENTLEPLK